MQTQFSLSKNKFFWIILSLVVLLAIPETRHALADYLGPNRRVVTSETEIIDVGVWAKPDPTGTSCTHTYGTDCVVCTWEGSPGNACGDATYSYKTGTETRTIDVVTYLPEATINGTLQNCNLSNGWCTNATTLLLTSTEPVPGESIIFVEGTRNGETFACPGTSCEIDLVAGDNTFTYWALSSYGDSSQMGTLTAKVDAAKPDIVPSISGTMGENGWFITDVTATFSASDPVPGSGLNTFETSLDNANWTPYVSPLVFTEGTYHLYVQATDFAANVRSLDDEIKVDTTAPTISGTISGTLGGANWYVTAPQASVTVTDTMSGIAAVEYNVDSGGWQPYSTAVTFDDGPHTIQFRTYDFAGWSAETETFSFKVDTTGPSIKLPSRWYIWESANFIVKDDQSKVVSVSYAIRDGQNRWKKVERNWTPNTHEFSRTISWNRVFADGITAPIGNYPVRVYAEDAAGNVSWKDAEIVIPGVDDPPLPTFTPTPTAEPTEEVVAPPADATATSTPIPPVSEEDDDDEETAPFVFGGKPDDAPDAEPEAPAPSSSVLWGAAAAAAIGTYQATMAEKKRREEEAARARRNSESAARRRAEKEGRLDEYIRDKRKAKEAAARAKEERIRQKDEDRRAAKKREQSGLSEKEWKAKEVQQAIWDANGAALYAQKIADEEVAKVDRRREALDTMRDKKILDPDPVYSGIVSSTISRFFRNRIVRERTTDNDETDNDSGVTIPPQSTEQYVRMSNVNEGVVVGSYGFTTLVGGAGGYAIGGPLAALAGAVGGVMWGAYEESCLSAVQEQFDIAYQQNGSIQIRREGISFIVHGDGSNTEAVANAPLSIAYVAITSLLKTGKIP